MKVKFILPFFLLFMIVSGCSVNCATGLITVENRTATTMTNIMIGQNSIALMVLPGQKVDYYFFQTVSGKLTSSGVTTENSSYIDLNDNRYRDPGEGIGEVNYSIKTSYWIKIYAYTISADRNMLNLSIDRQNGGVFSTKDYID